MTEDEISRAREDSRRFWLRNFSHILDYGRLVTEFLSAPRSVRWAITFFIVAVIMIGPIIGIVVALLN